MVSVLSSGGLYDLLLYYELVEYMCVRQSSKGTSIPPTEDLSPFSTMQSTIQFIYMLSIH